MNVKELYEQVDAKLRQLPGNNPIPPALPRWPLDEKRHEYFNRL